MAASQETRLSRLHSSLGIGSQPNTFVDEAHLWMPRSPLALACIVLRVRGQCHCRTCRLPETVRRRVRVRPLRFKKGLVNAEPERTWARRWHRSASLTVVAWLAVFACRLMLQVLKRAGWADRTLTATTSGIPSASGAWNGFSAARGREKPCGGSCALLRVREVGSV